tara:strand:- start:860 stop:1336 length:477 start_codon:yes stop_codon:yes gene_type:complete
MLNLLQNYLVPDSVYMWTNLGVLPFWLMLLLIPNLKITRILINSIILPSILAATYFYIIYQGILYGDTSVIEAFDLYNGLDNLYVVFSNEIILLTFWLHFLSINLFLGSWIAYDALKYNMPRTLVFLPLIVVYFTGPLGLLIYWLVRIPYAKKISFHD